MTEYKTNVKAIVALILGILSVLCCCVWYAGLVEGIVAVVLGILGYRDENPRQKDAAIAGIVLGAVGVALAISTAVVAIFFSTRMDPQMAPSSTVMLIRSML